MVDLLDEWIPVISGTEINDDPLSPISSKGKQLIKENGNIKENLIVNKDIIGYKNLFIDKNINVYGYINIKENTNILVYCAGGYRSALAGKTLIELGFPNVFNIGGFDEWINYGGEIQPYL